MSSGWSRRISKPQTEVGGPEREKVLGKPRVIDGPGEAGLSSQVLLVGTEIRKARGKSPHADHSFSRGTAVTCGQQAQCRHLLRRLSERRAAHPIGSLGEVSGVKPEGPPLAQEAQFLTRSGLRGSCLSVPKPSVSAQNTNRIPP